MSQNSTANKVITIILYVLLGVGFWLLLGGGLFLYLLEMDYNQARPWTGVQYYLAYPDNQEVLKQLGISHGSSLAVVVALAFLIFMPKTRSLYGDAKFAKSGDVKKAKLYNEQGIIYGKFNGKYLVADPDEYPHAILAAKTGAGKGVDTVITNALNWPGSLIVCDLKKECWEITSGFRRKHGQKVFLFSPTDPNGHTNCYNPFDYITRDKTLRIDDVQKIANIFFPSTPGKGEEDFFSGGAQSLFVGLTLMLIDIEEYPITIGEIYRQLNPASDICEYLESIINDYENRLDPVCIGELRNFINRPDKERGGVMNTLRTRLRLWQNPLVDAATSSSDFDLRRFRKEKTTLYIGIPQGDIDRLSVIINLLIQQFIQQNGDHEINKDGNKHRVLMINDEFPQYGRMDTVYRGVSWLRSYGVHLYNIIQSSSQLNSIYGENDAMTLIENSSRIVFAPNNTKDAEDISKTLGDMTVKNKSKSVSSKGDTSKSISDHKRALMLPQELRMLDKNKKIIILDGQKPIMANKIFYYEDPQFIDRYYNTRDPKKNKGEPPVLPTAISPTKHEIRGLLFAVDEVLEKIDLEPTDRDLSPEEIDDFAEQFFSALE